MLTSEPELGFVVLIVHESKFANSNSCTMKKTDRHPFVSRRRELGYTQQQIADVVRKTSRAIQKWEAGQTVPRLTFSEVADLCDFMQCTPRDLAKDFEARAKN